MVIKDKPVYDYPLFEDLKTGALFRVGNDYFIKIHGVTNQRDVTYNAVDVEFGIPTFIKASEPVKRIVAEIVTKQ